MARKKEPPMTPERLKSWIKARVEMTLHHVMTHVYKYDEGGITKDELREMVKREVESQINGVYDCGFADGVRGSADVEDEDNPVTFELEEDDEEDEG